MDPSQHTFRFRHVRRESSLRLKAGGRVGSHLPNAMEKKKKRETGLAKWNICDSSPLWIDIRGGEEKKDRNQFLLVLGIGSSAHRGQRSRVVFGLSFIPHRGRIDEIRGWTRVQLLACSTLAGNRITAGWKSAWKFACLRLKCFSFLWRD